MNNHNTRQTTLRYVNLILTQLSCLSQHHLTTIKVKALQSLLRDIVSPINSMNILVLNLWDEMYTSIVGAVVAIARRAHETDTSAELIDWSIYIST